MVDVSVSNRFNPIDQQRAEALSSALVSSEWLYANNKKQFEPDVEVDSSSKTTRIGLATARIIRAAGLVSLAVGSYGVATNVDELYQAIDAIVQDLGELDSAPMDRAASRLLTGNLSNVEQDAQTAATGYAEIDTVINTGVNEMVTQGGQAAEGVQDLVMGGALAIGGHIGVRTLKRRRQKSVSYLDTHWSTPDQLFTPPRKPHVSRTSPADNSEVITLRQTRHRGDRLNRAVYAHEKWYTVAAGAMLFSAMGISANVAQTADDTATAAVHETVIERVQEPLFENAAERFKESIANDILDAVETELPLTMAALDANPAAKAQYEQTVTELKEDSQGEVGKLAEVDAGASFFSRMRDRLHNGIFGTNSSVIAFVTAASAASLMALTRLRPIEFKRGKARVSKNFLNAHVEPHTKPFEFQYLEEPSQPQ